MINWHLRVRQLSIFKLSSLWLSCWKILRKHFRCNGNNKLGCWSSYWPHLKLTRASRLNRSLCCRVLILSQNLALNELLCSYIAISWVDWQGRYRTSYYLRSWVWGLCEYLVVIIRYIFHQGFTVDSVYLNNSNLDIPSGIFCEARWGVRLCFVKYSRARRDMTWWGTQMTDADNAPQQCTNLVCWPQSGINLRDKDPRYQGSYSDS